MTIESHEVSISQKIKVEIVPKVFLSYSWSSLDHEAFVLSLAKRLRANGINVVLDKWHLKEGHNVNSFMESMVNDNDISKVLIVSDQLYREKANSLVGGVGIETQIISPKLYSDQKQDKFIPIVTEYDENKKPCLPTYLEGRLFVDMSLSTGEDNFEQLVRCIYDKPLHKAPPIGKTPSYILNDEEVVSTSSPYDNLIRSLKDGGNASYYLKLYFEEYLNFFKSQKIIGTENWSYNAIYESVDNSLHYKDQFCDVVSMLIDFDKIELFENFFDFFEECLSLLSTPIGKSSYKSQYDNLSFMFYELFLSLQTILINRKMYGISNRFFSKHYFVKTELEAKNESFFVFDGYFAGLEEGRSGTPYENKVSVTATIMNERFNIKGLRFDDLMLAEYICWWRNENSSWRWFPKTLVYIESRFSPKFDFFIRAESLEFFDNCKTVLGVKSLSEFKAKWDKISGEELGQYRFSGAWGALPLKSLANLDSLGRLP